MCGLSFCCFYVQLRSRYKNIRGIVKQIEKKSRLISISISTGMEKERRDLFEISCQKGTKAG